MVARPPEIPPRALRALALALGAAVVAPRAAQADGGAPATGCANDARGCERIPGEFTGLGCDSLVGFTLDSGWLPDESEPIAFRIRAHLGGLIDDAGHAAKASLVSETAASWPDPIMVTVTGPGGRSQLRVAYGFEFTAEIKYDIGVSSGTRDIPLPYVGELNHYRLEGQAPLPNLGFGALTEVRAETPAYTIVDIDVLDIVLDPIDLGVIDVDIHGGFRFDVSGYGAARYRTTEFGVPTAGAPVLTYGGNVRVGPPTPAGYGPALDLTVEPEGELECEVGIELTPTLYIEIYGFELDWEIPIDLRLDRMADAPEFAPQTTHLALADASLDRTAIDLGLVEPGTRAEDTVTLTNHGEGMLIGFARAMNPAIRVSVASIAVAPGESLPVTISADPGLLTPDTAGVVFSTNDPDSPDLTVGVLGEVIAPPAPPTGGPDGGEPSDTPHGSAGDGRASWGGAYGSCAVTERTPARNRGSCWLIAPLVVLALTARRLRRDRVAQLSDRAIDRHSPNVPRP